MNIPTPYQEYLEDQKELSALQNKSYTRDIIWSVEHIHRDLESDFMSGWGLKKDAYRRAERLFCKLGSPDRLWDHMSFFQTSALSPLGLGRLVIVTQPYLEPYPIGMPVAKEHSAHSLADFARGIYKHRGIEVVVANEWAYYFPGSASMLLLSFPPIVVEQGVVK